MEKRLDVVGRNPVTDHRREGEDVASAAGAGLSGILDETLGPTQGDVNGGDRIGKAGPWSPPG